MKKFDQPFLHLNGPITSKHVDFFTKHGFIVFKNFIDKDTVARFLQEIGKVQDYLASNEIRKVNGIPLRYGQDVDGSTIIQRIAFTSHYSEVLSNFLKDPRLDSFRRLLPGYDARVGENEKDGLVFNHYVNTDKSNYKQLGWHTDSPRDLFLGSRKILPMLNVGLHLDDCSTDNGGLRVLGGTHRQGLFKLLFRKKYFVDNRPDKREIGFDIEAGDLTIHDGRLWHRVQLSPHMGERSRRRVMYIPIVTGAYQPKTAESPTPFYHKLALLTMKKDVGKRSLAGAALEPETIGQREQVAERA